jgi:hypothetical protein
MSFLCFTKHEMFDFENSMSFPSFSFRLDENRSSCSRPGSFHINSETNLRTFNKCVISQEVINQQVISQQVISQPLIDQLAIHLDKGRYLVDCTKLTSTTRLFLYIVQYLHQSHASIVYDLEHYGVEIHAKELSENQGNVMLVFRSRVVWRIILRRSIWIHRNRICGRQS